MHSQYAWDFPSRKDHIISLPKLAQVYSKFFQPIRGFNHPYMRYKTFWNGGVDSRIAFYQDFHPYCLSIISLIIKGSLTSLVHHHNNCFVLKVANIFHWEEFVICHSTKSHLLSDPNFHYYAHSFKFWKPLSLYFCLSLLIFTYTVSNAVYQHMTTLKLRNLLTRWWASQTIWKKKIIWINKYLYGNNS